MKKASEEFASAVDALTRRAREAQLTRLGEQLMGWVETDANRPKMNYRDLVPSIASEGLRKNYEANCRGVEGSLQIVYDRQGTGKSRALQLVARAKSIMQPSRFLVVNLPIPRSTNELFDAIKKQVLGTVQDFDFTGEEVARVVKHGLCGPASDESKKLPNTINKCRVSINSQVAYKKKYSEFPVLVIDEFNPTDFEDWPKHRDLTLKEITDTMGEAFEFFKMLAGLAYTGDGFVAFVGTRNEAFARALHQINGGTKAALAKCTTIPGTKSDAHGNIPFSAWRGFVWTPEDKEQVVRARFERDYKQALLQQGIPENQAEEKKEMTIRDLCSQNENIRNLCDQMEDALDAEMGQQATLLRTGTQLEGSQCCADLKMHLEDARANFRGCILM